MTSQQLGYYIGAAVGGLLPTFIVSRILLVILRGWRGEIRKIIFVHSISLIIATLLAGMGMADGGAFAAIKAFWQYLLPQAVWLAVDWLWFKRTGRIPFCRKGCDK